MIFLDFLERFFLRRKKGVTPTEVEEAIAKRDELFAEAEVATDAAKEAMWEVDRVQRGLIEDYEQAESERRRDR